MDTIKADAKIMETDYNNEDWYGTALEASSVAKIALPVPSALGTANCGDF